jgi:hypothetical protein
MISPDGIAIMPFGKYRGQPVDSLLHDPGYVAWLLNQEWLQARYPQVHSYIHSLNTSALRRCRICGGPACMDDLCAAHFRRETAGDFTDWESELASL